jgi:hypothetical protein
MYVLPDDFSFHQPLVNTHQLTIITSISQPDNLLIIKARVEEAKASESIRQSVLWMGRGMLEKIKEINIHTYENLNSNSFIP